MFLRLILASAIISLAATKAVKNVDFDIDSALCENRLSAFLVTDNADVSISPSREYSNVTEEECMETCNSNRDSDGRLVICASFSYDHVHFKCNIYKKKAGPDGDLEKITAAGKRYFEKFCLEEDAPTQCASAQFVRIDDSILSGYAQNTSIHTTLAGCINQCLKEEFVCKSAMYFYEEGECITNLESGQNKPEDFGTPDDGDKVVYFSNGCVQIENDKNETTVAEVKEEKNEATEKPVIEEKTSTTAKPETDSGKSTTAEQSTTEEKTTVASATTPKQDEDEEDKSEERKEALMDIENKLYGAKQLSRDENGTISIDESLIKVETNTTENPKEIKKTDEKSEDDSETKATSTPETTKEAKDDKKEPTDEVTSTASLKEEAANSTTEASPMLEIDDDTDSKEADPKKEETEEIKEINVLKNPLKAAANKNLQIKKLLNAPEPEQPQEEEESYFGKWSDWTECTQPGQRKIRRRKCLNLRKCKGALMQVDWCPKVLPNTEQPTEQPETGPIGPTRNPLPVAKDSSSGSPPGILPPQLPQKVLKPLPEGAPGHPDDVWSPWLGTCQQFASNQPCRNNEVIGFESRECIAKDPKACKGPFFRYCTLPC